MCDEFCLIHGYEHMSKKTVFDLVARCTECDIEREKEEKAKRPFYPEFLRYRNDEDEGFECPNPITCQFPRCDCK